jgi:hypothetical protein
MIIGKANALQSLRPNAQWSLIGDRLEWLDENQTQPTDAESDPLFFKAQRGEATMEEWQAKVAEIKTRFPKD